MIKDLIRVGPPQGSMNDLDLGVPKEFSKEMRMDFEKELDAKKQDKQDRDLDQVSKKSSGGIKRKMTKAKDEESEADKPEKKVKADVNVQPLAIDEKISMIMVSNEGEVEIADSDKNLPQIASEQAKILNAQEQMSGQMPAVMDNAQSQESALLSEDLAVQLPMADSPQLSQEESFIHLNEIEKELLADINQKPTLLSAQEQNAQELELAETTVQVGASEAKSSLESKAYDILSKENLQAGAESKLDAATALNQTDTVLMQASNEQEKSQGDQQQSSNDSMGENSSQSQARFDATNDLAAQVSALHTEQRSFQSHLGGAMGAANSERNNSAGDALKDENVREIMNQAKFLVTKGGGEMTVKMTPEGMGEVQLKVALENGKINIEMNSQDKAVKKLIEDSLSDLKSSLASHQMRVEHVKINNVTAVDTNNQAQFQSDGNSSNSSFQNRQHQEMNFQNMTNSNSGRGQQHGHRQSSSQPAVQAPIVKANVRANAYTAANKGSSINMVA